MFVFEFMFEFYLVLSCSQVRCSSISSSILCSGLSLTSSLGSSSSSSSIKVGSSVRFDSLSNQIST